jgi:hypothetical protein
VASDVFDHSNIPEGYGLLVVLNIAWSIIAFFWLVANCSENDTERFVLEQNQMGVKIEIVLGLAVRLALAIALLEMYIYEEDESFQFIHKTIFLFASIASFITCGIIFSLIFFSTQTRKEAAKATNPSKTTKMMMKPYNHNHILPLSNKPKPQYKIRSSRRVGRFVS